MYLGPLGFPQLNNWLPLLIQVELCRSATDAGRTRLPTTNSASLAFIRTTKPAPLRLLEVFARRLSFTSSPGSDRRPSSLEREIPAGGSVSKSRRSGSLPAPTVGQAPAFAHRLDRRKSSGLARRLVESAKMGRWRWARMGCQGCRAE